MGELDAQTRLSPTDSGRTKVAGSFDTNMRKGAPVHMQPTSTYFGFFMEGMLGPSYEEGLTNPKEVAEAS